MNELTDEWIHAWVVWPCTDHWMNEQTYWHRHGFSLLETIFWFRVSFWCVVDLPLLTGFYTEPPHITPRIYSTEETHFTWMNKKKNTNALNTRTLLENLWYLCLHTVHFFFSSSEVMMERGHVSLVVATVSVHLFYFFIINVYTSVK